MSSESTETRPLRPSHASSITHTLCMALSDLLHEDGNDLDRRAYVKACGLAAAAEVFSGEATGWYFQQMGEDHDLLEALQDRWLSGRAAGIRSAGE